MRDDRVYLLHPRDAIERSSNYASRDKSAFFTDSKTQDVAVRNLEIIGEAVKNVSAGLKIAHANIPWKRIAGLIDKMIHEYFGVNLQLVWNMVERDLPDFKREVEGILTGMEDTNEVS